MSGGEPPAGTAPVLRVVRGDATAEELAALVAVLAAVRAGAGEGRGRDRSDRSTWADHAAVLRAPLQPGPGAWRASARPR